MSQMNMLAIDLAPSTDKTSVSANNNGSEKESQSAFSEVMAQHKKAESGKYSQSSDKVVEKNTHGNEKESLAKNVEKDSRVAQHEETAQESEHSSIKKAGDNQASADDTSQKTTADEKSIKLDNVAVQSTSDAEKEKDIAEQLLSFLVASNGVSTKHVEHTSEGKLVEGAETANHHSSQKVATANSGSTANSGITGDSSQDDVEAKLTSKTEESSVPDKNAIGKLASKDTAEMNLDKKAINDVFKASEEGAAKTEGNAPKAENIAGNKLAGEELPDNKLGLDKAVNANNVKAHREADVNNTNSGVEKKVDVAPAMTMKNTEESLANKFDKIVDVIDEDVKPSTVNMKEEKTASNSSQIAADAIKNIKAENTAHNDNTVASHSENASKVAASIESVVQQNQQQGNEKSKLDNQLSNLQSRTASDKVISSDSQTSNGKHSSEQQANSDAKNQNQLNISNDVEVKKENIDLSDKKVFEGFVEKKAIETTVTESLFARNSAQQTMNFAEEQAMQNHIVSANADSMSVQSSKTAINIQNETIAIYRKDFSNAVKEKVMVMMNQKLKEVEIRLDPPELGSMHIKLNLQNEQAAVSFMVQNQQAKEALEQNIGKLKDMLAESGVDVGDANIEKRDSQSTEADDFGQQAKGQNGELEHDDFDENTLVPGANLYKASATGVDYYA